jgi:iron complex transport system ATP-binding protein
LIWTVRLAAGFKNLPVVREATLEVKAGEFVAVIGPNASGKTTLLKTLASLLKPLTGVVYLDSTPLSRMRRNEIAKSIGVVLTEQPAPGRLKVFELVALGRYPHTGPLGRLSERDREETMRVLSDVGVSHLAGRLFSELSDGQKQKVLIARALAQNPRVLMLDEPVTFLDPRARVEVLLTLRKICRERRVAVIASLHEIELALRLADRLIVVANGSVESYAPPEEFVEQGGPRALYGMSDGSCFNPDLMSIELRSLPSRGPVFVVAGGGTGAPLYRMLSRQEYQIITGVLHKGDIDYSVASALGATVIWEEPFTPIRPQTIEEALEKARTAFAAIYTSPPIGPTNSANQRLAGLLALRGIPLIVLGKGQVEGAWSRIRTLGEVSQALEELENAILERERVVEP